jgi:hypothetical protein
MSMAFLRKLERNINQVIPDGLLSPRYLFPFQTDHMRIHRQIWWASKHPKLPRPIWCLLQLIFWLRWVLFSGWVHTFSVMKSRHADVTKHYGISYWEQLRQCLWGAISWSIPSNELYNYQVIQTRAPLLDFIYSNETKGWHALQNKTHPNARASQQLLGDKRAFSQHMTAQGFPVVAESVNPVFDTSRPFSDQFSTDHAPIFCKLRRGNQALHAFAAYMDQGHLKGHLQTGKALNTASEVAAAWDTLIAHGEPVVQPCLLNHQEIAAVTCSDRIANLRVVTRGGTVGAATMTLYTADETITTYWLDVEPVTGRPYLPIEIYPAYHPKLNVIQPLADKAPEIIPFWDEICAHSLRAHTEEFDLWAIAWDWAVTPDGPMLLEGNSGWGLQDWQLQSGSLLLPFDGDRQN